MNALYALMDEGNFQGVLTTLKRKKKLVNPFLSLLARVEIECPWNHSIQPLDLSLPTVLASYVPSELVSEARDSEDDLSKIILARLLYNSNNTSVDVPAVKTMDTPPVVKTMDTRLEVSMSLQSAILRALSKNSSDELADSVAYVTSQSEPIPQYRRVWMQFALYYHCLLHYTNKFSPFTAFIPNSPSVRRWIECRESALQMLRWPHLTDPQRLNALEMYLQSVEVVGGRHTSKRFTGFVPRSDAEDLSMCVMLMEGLAVKLNLPDLNFTRRLRDIGIVGPTIDRIKEDFKQSIVSVQHYRELFFSLVAGRRYDEAIVAAREVYRGGINDAGFLYAYARLAFINFETDCIEKVIALALTTCEDDLIGPLHYLRSAVEYRESGQAEGLQAALQADPSNDSYLYSHALLAATSGDVEKATALCKEALEINPDNCTAWNLLTLLVQVTGGEDSALQVCESSLDYCPQNYDLLLTKAHLMERTHSLDDNITFLTDLISTILGDRRVRFEGDVDVSSLEKWLQTFPRSQTSTRRKSHCDFDSPTRTCQPVITFSHGDCQSRYLCRLYLRITALFLRHQRPLVDCETIARLALRTDPLYPPALATLAHILSLRGDHCGARDTYHDALAIDSACIPALLGLVKESEGVQIKERWLREAERIAPHQPEVLHQLALEASAVGQFDRAKDLLSRALSTPQPIRPFKELPFYL